MVHADSEHRPRPPGGYAVVLLAALSKALRVIESSSVADKPH
ncbi:hypothetical protein PXO_05756 [Xanthomonas oryzae pv. oryzae PXO99A]|uniref:Uncharacterized protein n=1 Tax=Xanthomonas oryzae pv. oryzae (strain PXO99A) TaxID=360094 RepID=A0A0K0GQ80_XANOP|nr:hypothetical protein PXO_05756 [Xanthomonas oryzae pv. oryzae PXO99A]